MTLLRLLRLFIVSANTTGFRGENSNVGPGYYIRERELIHFNAVLTNPDTGVLIYSDDLLYHVNVAKEILS